MVRDNKGNQPKTSGDCAPTSGEAKQLDEHVDDDDGGHHRQKKNTKVCPECHKVFGSGKALGGHMRIHVQAYKGLLISNKKKKLRAKQSIKFKKEKKRPKVFILGQYEDRTRSATISEVDKKNKKPTCVLCGKNFPSMKSLFGHMRCHPGRDWRGIEPPPPAAAKNNSLSSVLDVAEIDNDDEQIGDDSAGNTSNIGEEEELCAVNLTDYLPKWPVTAKRGRRPANFMTDNSSLSILRSSEPEEDEVEEELREAADDLMMLAKDSIDQSSAIYQMNKEGESFEATNSHTLSSKFENDADDPVDGLKWRKLEEHSQDVSDDDQILMQLSEGKDSSEVSRNAKGLQQSSGGGKGNSVVPQSEDWPNKECGHQGGSDNEESEMNHNKGDEQSPLGKHITIKNRKKRRKMKLRDLEFQVPDAISPVHHTPVTMVAADTTTPDRYRCNTCDKCFSTHQALGGHRSSHNKFRIVIHNSIDENSAAAAAQEKENPGNDPLISLVEENKDSDEGALSSSKLVDSSTQHQCNVCNKNFPSGQALGGHKRCHWSGPMEAAQSSLGLEVLSPGEVSCHNTSGRRMLNFDLNESPAVEENEALHVDSDQQLVSVIHLHRTIQMVD